MALNRYTAREFLKPRPFLDIAAQASDLHGRNTGAAEHPLGATWAFCGHLWV